MSQSVIVGGSNYTVPDVGERAWGQNVTDLLIGLATAITGAGGSGGIDVVQISSSPVNVVSGKTYLVNTSAARTFNLPAPAANAFFAVRDISGSAETNNITINRAGTEQIDGVAANKTLSINRGYWIFACDGTNWFTLLNYPVNLDQLASANGQVLRLPGGSVATPSLEIGVTGTGFCNIGSGTIAVSSGNQIARFDSAGLVLTSDITMGSNMIKAVGRIDVYDGSAGAPSITNYNDYNTGIYFPAADTIGISTSGAQRLLITSAGHIVTMGGSDQAKSMISFSTDGVDISPQNYTSRSDGELGAIFSGSNVSFPNFSIGVFNAGAQDSQKGAQIDLGGKYDSDSKVTTFGSIRAVKTNATAGDREGQVELGSYTSSGGYTTRIRCYGTTGAGTVIGIDPANNSTPSFVFPAYLTVGATSGTWAVPPSQIALLVTAPIDTSTGNLLIADKNATVDSGGALGLGGRYNTGATNSTTHAMITGRKANSTDSNRDGYLQILVNKNGSGLVEIVRIDGNTRNMGINTTAQFGSGAGVIGIANATTNPSTNPTGGGVLYSDAGALKWRGSSGTVTTIAPA